MYCGWMGEGDIDGCLELPLHSGITFGSVDQIGGQGLNTGW